MTVYLFVHPPTYLSICSSTVYLTHVETIPTLESTEAVWGGTRPLRAVAGGRAPGPHHSPGRLVGTAEPRAGWGTGRFITEPPPPGCQDRSAE